MIAAGRPTCDREEIMRTWDAFVPPGGVIELRAIKARTVDDRYSGTVSGYFDNGPALADAVARITEASGVYITANPVNPALLARSVNKARRVQSDPTTSDHDIPQRRFLLVDCDAVRPAGISASDEEHEASLERAQQIKAQLFLWGWPAPIEGDSGNGAHLCYRINLPADDGGLVNKALLALSGLFSDDQVKVDTSVHNPARIWKLYGTVACKGDHDAEHGRPHRMARLLAVPEELQVVPQALLEELADDVLDDSTTSKSKPANGNQDSFDIEVWMQQRGLAIKATRDRQNGSRFYVLEECPWNSEHRDSSAFIGRRASGAIIAGCRHNSCQGLGWHDLRAKLDPAWAERRAKWEQGNGSKSGSQKATPNGRPEHDPSEAPFDDDSGNYFLDKQRRGEAKHGSSVGSGFGNDGDEQQKPDAPPFAPRSVAELLEQNTALRQPVVDGLLRRGETANIVSAPKIGKSHLTLELAVAVVTGSRFIDKFDCPQGRVLLIDNELHPQTLASRIRRLLVRRQLDVSAVEGLDVECLRGRLRDLHAMRSYFDGIEPGSYSLIIIDALYRFLPKGTDENSNADICALYNEIDAHADRIGCGFALIHHTSKGSQSSKAVTDVGSGAGSQSRAVDTHLVLRHHEEKGAVVVDAALRSWPPIEPFCMRWDYPRWNLAGDLDPADLRPERPPQRKKKKATEIDDVASVLPELGWDIEKFVSTFLSAEPRVKTELLEIAAKHDGLSRRRAEQLCDAAVDTEKAYEWTFGRNRKKLIATVPQPQLEGATTHSEVSGTSEACEDGEEN